MLDIIQLLPDHVANQIAAGEVVQRPASVVKELLENAIDAGATQVKLLIKDAGKSLIQVIDDGSGMSTTDARLCFERHATSKIKTSDDLFKLHTKGFRGEALASIAAVAQVELKTNTEKAEVGTAIKIEGSEVVSQEVAVTPKGTSIAVKNLFFNVPARRNFLKSNTVESRHIIDEFHRVALAHPSVSFVLLNNGSEVFNLPASNLRQRIVNIFGSKANEKLVPIEESTDVVSVNGFVIKPDFAKKSRGDQFFFVNHRFIKSGYLHHAVVSAFEGLLKDGTQPGYFLFLEVDPTSIDINIHPTKTEIKFEDEHSVYAILRASIKHSLGQFNIAPALDFDRDDSLDTPYEYHKKQPQLPEVEVDRNFNPFKETQRFGNTQKSQAGWESLYSGTQPTDTAQHDFVNGIEVESEEVTSSLFSNDTQERAAITFQIKNKYIITSIKDGLLVINQQAAHERVLYEEFLKSITVKEGVSQQLLFPLELHFSTDDIRCIDEIKEQLQSTGFVFDRIESETVAITGIPVMVKESDVSAVLEDLVGEIKDDIPETTFSQNDLLAKTMAKRLSVKTGTPLLQTQQEHLVNSLFACKEPDVSPTHHPTFVRIDTHDLDKKFKL